MASMLQVFTVWFGINHYYLSINERSSMDNLFGKRNARPYIFYFEQHPFFISMRCQTRQRWTDYVLFIVLSWLLTSLWKKNTLYIMLYNYWWESSGFVPSFLHMYSINTYLISIISIGLRLNALHVNPFPLQPMIQLSKGTIIHCDYKHGEPCLIFLVLWPVSCLEFLSRQTNWSLVWNIQFWVMKNWDCLTLVHYTNNILSSIKSRENLERQ